MVSTLPSDGNDQAVTYVEGFAPGFLERIAKMHGEYYAKAWGIGLRFEELMARELSEFCETYDPDRDLLLTAHVGDMLIGSVAIVGTQSKRPDAARLRWYIVAEEHHGRGIGSMLLSRAIDFCRSRNVPMVYVWTVEGLPESLHLYQKFGFRVAERLRDSRYTMEHTQLRLELPLSAEPAAGSSTGSNADDTSG